MLAIFDTYYYYVEHTITDAEGRKNFNMNKIQFLRLLRQKWIEIVKWTSSSHCHSICSIDNAENGREKKIFMDNQDGRIEIIVLADDWDRIEEKKNEMNRRQNKVI